MESIEVKEIEAAEEMPAIFKLAQVKNMEELHLKLSNVLYEKIWREGASDLRADAQGADAQVKYWEEMLERKRAEAQSYEHAYSAPQQRIAIPAEQLALKLAAKSACEQQVADCQTLLGAYLSQRAEISRQAAEISTLLTISDVLYLRKKPDEKSLAMLPGEEREKIEAHWRLRDKRERLDAERQRQAEMERQRQAEIEAQKRLAAVEHYGLDELLDAVFEDPRGLWQLRDIPEAFRARTLTAVQFQQFAKHKPTDTMVKARACERLLEIGTEILKEIALAPPPAPPTEAEIASMRERQIAEYLDSLDRMNFSGLVEEANKLAIISPALYDRLNAPNMDSGTRTTISQHLKDMLAAETDPLRRGTLGRLRLRLDEAGARQSVGSGTGIRY